jgi:hypothetical protein
MPMSRTGFFFGPNQMGLARFPTAIHQMKLAHLAFDLFEFLSPEFLTTEALISLDSALQVRAAAKYLVCHDNRYNAKLTLINPTTHAFPRCAIRR